MKLLLHTCCAPCSIYPVRVLREAGMEVTGFFYRYNIHPFTECLKRENALKAYAPAIGLPVIYQQGYDIDQFFRNAVYRESQRCLACYHERLKTTARMAAEGKFDAFTSTLLYSKFQNHEAIREIGESEGKAAGVPFYYQDFRLGWKEGVTASKELGMYRQQYCGCVYSEKDRYYDES